MLAKWYAYQQFAPAVEKIERTASGARRCGATSGVFDLLHVGHLDTLWQARAELDGLLGETAPLIVFVADDSIAAKKGPGRPIIPFYPRVTLVRALRCVDLVTGGDDIEKFLKHLQPAAYFKGPTTAVIPAAEQQIVEAGGGVVVKFEQSFVLAHADGESTTAIAERAGLAALASKLAALNRTSDASTDVPG